MNQSAVRRWADAPGHRLAIGWMTGSDRWTWSVEDGIAERPGARAVYEIGSITKTMTGLLLAIGEREGLWSGENKLAELVPGWSGSSFAEAATLRRLVTHTANLPRIPGNMQATIADKLNPYANYSDEHLKEAILAEPVRKGNRHAYSNYGFGILGYALAARLGTSLSEALRDRIFSPLGMNDTSLRSGTFWPDPSGLVPVYSAKGTPTPHWDFTDATAGAGAVCSTVPDMLDYLAANLEPGRLPIGDAIMDGHKEHYAIFAGKGIGVGYSWMFYREKDGSTTHWHNGGTYGSSSFLAFNRDKGKGLVILSNRGADVWSQIPLVGMRKLSVDKLARKLLEGFYQ
jgi:CubicO group peptidase (beta-lactamase class C family)